MTRRWNGGTGLIYKIACVKNKRTYIGVTTGVPASQEYCKIPLDSPRDVLKQIPRLFAHVRSLQLGRHISPELQHDFNKYGIESFYFEVLEISIFSGYEHIHEQEKRWKHKFNAGYCKDYRNEIKTKLLEKIGLGAALALIDDRAIIQSAPKKIRTRKHDPNQLDLFSSFSEH